MSFEIVCENCGAVSGPSVGVCPFCKSVLATAKKDQNPTLTKIRERYQAGKMEDALAMCASAQKLDDNPSFLMLYAQVLFETEGPTSQMRSLLLRAQTLKPDDGAIADFLELLEAKHLMTHEGFDEGRILLRSLLRRSPNHVHALFLLGSQSFHIAGDVAESIRLLERCVSLRPCFLRAWGCLGVIYRKIGNAQSASRAFKKAAALETNPKMKAFFKNAA